MNIPVLPVNSKPASDAVIISITSQAEEIKDAQKDEISQETVSEGKQADKKLSASEISFLKVLIGSNPGAV